MDVELNLNTAVARLREALGDSAEHPRYIETLPRRGYRFLAAARASGASEPTPRRRVRVIVLPLTNVGGDPAEDYFSDAMTEEIITALCQVAPEHVAVIGRTTAMHYRRSRKDVARVGRELGVDYVLEGGVRRDDGRVAINVQLIQVTDQTHVFAAKYDTEMRDVFGLHARIAADVATHIPGVPGLDVAGQAARKPTEVLPAYELFIQGRHHMYKMTPEAMTSAGKHFEKCIALDPRLAPAYDALGELYWWIAFFGFVPPKEAASAGVWAALRAVEIDPTLAETHALLGLLRVELDYDWREVLREMTLAMELDPSSPLVRFRYALGGLLPHGRLAEGITQLERALEFDPLSWLLHCWLSVLLWLARDYDRAMREARFQEELGLESYVAQFMIGNIYRDSGMVQEAIAHNRRAVELSCGAPQMLGWLGLTLAQSGNAAEARSLLDQLLTMADQTYVSPTPVAWIQVGLGEIDDAFVWLERAIDDRDMNITPIKSLPFLDPLRDDPRYLALLRKMNLEP